MSRAVAAALPMLLILGQCAPPPPPSGQAKADAETLAACRAHADEVYDRQYRDRIYTINNPNSPYSANDAYGTVDHGLAQRFGYQSMTNDCVRNHGHRERSHHYPAGRPHIPWTARRWTSKSCAGQAVNRQFPEPRDVSVAPKTL